jgi:hypothetical protein
VQVIWVGPVVVATVIAGLFAHPVIDGLVGVGVHVVPDWVPTVNP